MNIKILSRTPWSELEKKIREVPLIKPDDGGNQIFVYEKANINLRQLPVEEINPASFYVVKKNLEFQQELRDYLLKEHNIDSLQLNEALEIENESGEIWTLMPPVVEMMKETARFDNDRGDIEYDHSEKITMPVLNDGLHRVYTAKQLGVDPTVIVISSLPDEHPFYAYPNSWDKVQVFDDVPKEKQEKKLYRREERLRIAPWSSPAASTSSARYWTSCRGAAPETEREPARGAGGA